MQLKSLHFFTLALCWIIANVGKYWQSMKIPSFLNLFNIANAKSGSVESTCFGNPPKRDCITRLFRLWIVRINGGLNKSHSWLSSGFYIFQKLHLFFYIFIRIFVATKAKRGWVNSVLPCIRHLQFHSSKATWRPTPPPPLSGCCLIWLEDLAKKIPR